MLLQERLETEQLLRDTLDVVQPIDADDDLDTLKPPLERLYTLPDAIASQLLDELARLNADWVRADVHVSALEFSAVRHRWKPENARARGEEMTCVVVCVETDQIAVQDSEQDLASDW